VECLQLPAGSAVATHCNKSQFACSNASWLNVLCLWQCRAAYLKPLSCGHSQRQQLQYISSTSVAPATLLLQGSQEPHFSEAAVVSVQHECICSSHHMSYNLHCMHQTLNYGCWVHLQPGCSMLADASAFATS
jgi:hypothetical protein